MNKKINRIVFHNNPANFDKILWRMTGGNREKAFSLIKDICRRYDFEPDDFHIEHALADLMGGLDIEWNS